MLKADVMSEVTSKTQIFRKITGESDTLTKVIPATDVPMRTASMRAGAGWFCLIADPVARSDMTA